MVWYWLDFFLSLSRCLYRLSGALANGFLMVQARSPTLTNTELREKLLREKVKALRKTGQEGKELEAHPA